MTLPEVICVSIDSKILEASLKKDSWVRKFKKKTEKKWSESHWSQAGFKISILNDLAKKKLSREYILITN